MTTLSTPDPLAPLRTLASAFRIQYPDTPAPYSENTYIDLVDAFPIHPTHVGRLRLYLPNEESVLLLVRVTQYGAAMVFIRSQRASRDNQHTPFDDEGHLLTSQTGQTPHQPIIPLIDAGVSVAINATDHMPIILALQCLQDVLRRQFSNPEPITPTNNTDSTDANTTRHVP